MKNMTTVLLSILAGGLTAFGVVKATAPQPASEPTTVVTDAAGNTVEYRTVNLADSDYPDFTYAAETAVEAVVYVEVTVQSQSRSIDPLSSSSVSATATASASPGSSGAAAPA